MSELKVSLLNRRFFCGIVLIFIAVLAVAHPYRAFLTESGGSAEGPAWMAVFTYGVSSERTLLFLPLFVPLGAAGDVQEELKSRYAVFLVSRAGKKELSGREDPGGGAFRRTDGCGRVCGCPGCDRSLVCRHPGSERTGTSGDLPAAPGCPVRFSVRLPERSALGPCRKRGGGAYEESLSGLCGAVYPVLCPDGISGTVL